MSADPSQWLGLLRWSLAYSDGTQPTNVAAMSEEDKRWLEQVMKEVVQDDAKRMSEIMLEIKRVYDMEVYNLQEQEQEQEQEGLCVLLEELRDIIEQIDMAQVFVKFGNIPLLLEVLSSEAKFSEEVRIAAAGVVATVCQNNLMVQDALYTSPALDTLIQLFLATSSNNLRSKIFYAISCLIRGHAAAEEYFVTRRSQEVLANALSAPPIVTSTVTHSVNSSLLTRTLFLMNALITSDHANNERVARLLKVFLPQGLQLLLHEDFLVRDSSLSFLETITATLLGHRLLSVQHITLIQELFQRFTALANEDDEERGEELERWHLLLQSLGEPPRPKYPIKEHSLSTTQPQGNDENEAQQQPILLIEPPPLVASPRAP